MFNIEWILVLIGLVIAAVLLFIYMRRREKYVVQPMDTSPEVEFIQQQPDVHGVDPVTGEEMIVKGDLALYPGIGVGQGLVGFGRNAQSWMI